MVKQVLLAYMDDAAVKTLVLHGKAVEEGW
jgi:hypothetical protein